MPDRVLPRIEIFCPFFIGLCPQQSILYDMLTPREHLNMYGKLKGVLNSTELKKDVDR